MQPPAHLLMAVQQSQEGDNKSRAPDSGTGPFLGSICTNLTVGNCWRLYFVVCFVLDEQFLFMFRCPLSSVGLMI